MIDQNLLDEIKKIKVDITETQIFDRLLDRFRWPKRHQTGPLIQMELKVKIFFQMMVT
jgi:hypothetical protein